MDIKRLRYFVAVASERSFTRAAARLNMAQPPLSRRIQEIEEEVGVRLIERDVRPLNLTPAGRLFYEQALQVLGRLDQMTETMTRFIGSERPRFVLGLIPSGFHDRLPQLIRRYRILAPEVDLVLSEMSSVEQAVALKEGRIDAGLGRVRIDDSAIRREVLRQEPVLAALPPGSMRKLSNEPVDLAAVSRFPVILYPRDERPSFADQILSFFQDAGIQPDNTIEVRELQTALIMVAAGVGTCLVPASSQGLAHPDVVFRPLRPAITSPIVLSHRAGDDSIQLRALFRTFCALYEEWGYPTPKALQQKWIE